MFNFIAKLKLMAEVMLPPELFFAQEIPPPDFSLQVFKLVLDLRRKN
jgi:hypothetical protein